MDTVLSIFFFTIQCGRGTHVHPSVSSVAENIACSQKSTCLTCWPWCYSVRPCHRMTSVTHRSLSSLPPQPTLLMLTHWHKFFLTVLVCRPSVCSPLSVLSFPYFLFFLLPSLPEGLCFFFFSFLFFFLFFLPLCLLLSHLPLSFSRSLCLSLAPCLSFLCVFSQTYSGGPWRAAGDDSCISSRLRGHFRSAPLRLSSTVWATETKREEYEGVVNGKYWKTARWELEYI